MKVYKAKGGFKASKIQILFYVTMATIKAGIMYCALYQPDFDAVLNGLTRAKVEKGLREALAERGNNVEYLGDNFTEDEMEKINAKALELFPEFE